MLRLLIPCLLWLASVRSDSMHMNMEMMDSGMMDSSMSKLKRGYIHDPCPPQYHVPSYHPPPVLWKPYEQPSYPKKEVTVHQPPAQIQYKYVQHQPSYAIAKPMVTYVKPQMSYQPVHPPVYHPPVQYSPPKMIYQKPMYSYTPVYQKPMYEMPKIYVKKYEVPAVQSQIVYQKPAVVYKPQPVSYAQHQQPKYIHIQAAPVSYVKYAQPAMAHPQVYLPAPQPAHPPIVKIAKPMSMPMSMCD